MNTRGMGRVFRRGNVWWCAYWDRRAGKERRESGGTKRQAAVDLLKARLKELGEGRTFDEARRVTLADLKALLATDYELNHRRSWRRAQQSWAHLAGYFGPNEPAVTITAARLSGYVQARLAAGASTGTVKVELAALKHAVRLARRDEALLPHEGPSSFPKIGASRPRQGFLDPDEVERIKAALPPDERDLIAFLSWSAWRVGEALALRWASVDETRRTIRIEGTATKNGKARLLPYGALPQLVEILDHRRQVTDAVQRERDMVVPLVFHRGGEPIRYFRRAWLTACLKAGVPGRIVHDLRRSAARAMVRAGVAQPVAMAIGGWKTDVVFRAYAIVDEKVIAEGLAKLATAPAAPASTVQPFKARR